MEANKINRRGFLKAVGIAGITAAASKALCEPNEPNKCSDPNKPKQESQTILPLVPKRKLGRAGVEVPILALGGSDYTNSQIILQKAYDFGVRYLDSAARYGNGNSEIGIGMFIEKNPELRKDLFIVTKTDQVKTVAEMEAGLQKSLGRLKTNYVDMFFGLHGMKDASELTNEMKDWAADAKKRGVIKYFGFSTHSDMQAHLEAAAKLDWIDAIMTTYNYRLMQDAKMQAAVDACHKAGVGLIAMKTQGMRHRRGEQPQQQEDQKVGEHFTKKGYSEHQAKLKMVWEDERFASICSRIDNLTVLMANTAAALDRTKMDEPDKAVLTTHAQATCSGYCAGCDAICASATQGHISDVMRCLMYENSYGDSAKAREVFANIPQGVRANLLNIDYSIAEARCPQHLPIANLMAEAVGKFA